MAVPSALLLISTGCPHCPHVMTALTEQLKQGKLSQLHIINLSQQPDVAEKYQVRSVPWFRIGELEFQGLHSAQEIQQWISLAQSEEGIREYLTHLLAEGQIQQVENKLSEHPHWLALLIPVLGDMEAPLQARIGVTVLFESWQGRDVLHTVIPALLQLTQHTDPRARADACYCLGFTGSQNVRATLQRCLQDDSQEVREIAHEALAQLDRLTVHTASRTSA